MSAKAWLILLVPMIMLTACIILCGRFTHNPQTPPTQKEIEVLTISKAYSNDDWEIMKIITDTEHNRQYIMVRDGHGLCITPRLPALPKKKIEVIK